MSDKEGIRRPTRFRRFIALFRKSADDDEATEEALSELEEGGLIDPDESEMMQGILYLDKTSVREVMVPRTEIAYVDQHAPIREIVQTIVDAGHSRLLVVNEDLDSVVGYVNVKDVMRFWGREASFRLELVLRQVYVVPETKKLDDLLASLQERREQFALVIDEFGGTAGLVSIEDILEEIVGEIDDEYDHGEPHIFVREENAVSISGRFEMEKLGELLGIEAPEGGFNTVSGWILDRIGRVPTVGESFVLDDLDVLIEGATERQIRRVRIARRPPAEADE
jgi:magnesium and cobalt transporter